MARSLRFLILLVGCGLCACSGSPGEADAGFSSADANPSTPDADPDIAVELGTGTIDFEVLAPEQELELISGEQGAYHFVVHARMQGLVRGDPSMPGLIGNPQTRFAAFREDGRQLDEMAPPYRLGYQEEAGAWSTLPSGRLLVIQEGFVEAIIGTRVLLRVWVTDVSGEMGTDERWIRVLAPNE